VSGSTGITLDDVESPFNNKATASLRNGKRIRVATRIIFREAADAFRHMEQGRHFGKIVVSI